jgi:alpha-L-rhamnosidase
VRLAPQPDPRLKWARGSLNSAAGRYESQWRIEEDGALSFRFRIPFNAQATLRLPDADLAGVTVNGSAIADAPVACEQSGSTVRAELPAGHWEFRYVPTAAYIRYFSVDSPLGDIVEHEAARKAVYEFLPERARNADRSAVRRFAAMSLRELASRPIFGVNEETLAKMDAALRQIRMDE